MLAELRRLWDHAYRADRALLAALREGAGVPTDALRELAHIVGAAEVWLARVEGRASRCAVWPEPDLAAIAGLSERIHADYAVCLAAMREPDLERRVRYTNSAGQSFENTVTEILLHAAMHGQYHRGKVNLLLRQAGREPVPADYIAYLRGAPAATQAGARRDRARG